MQASPDDLGARPGGAARYVSTFSPSEGGSSDVWPTLGPPWDALTGTEGGPDPAADLAVAEWELDQSRTRIVELELSVLREIESSARASEAIIQIGSPAVPVLVEALADTNPETRRWAATVLGRMGQDAAGAIDSLRHMGNPELKALLRRVVARIFSEVPVEDKHTGSDAGHVGHGTPIGRGSGGSP